jgi:toxin FitB
MESSGNLVLIRWLLDTNVLSETRKKRVDNGVANWLSSVVTEQICTSAMNIAELEYGAIVTKDDLKQIEITGWIESELKPWLSDRIFAIDEDVLLRWRILSRQREIKQQPAPPVDILIAAVAQENGLYVATRDVAPFVACGIPTLNPWTGERFNGA